MQYRRVPEIEDKLSKLEELIRKDKYDSDEFKQLLTAMEKMLGFSDPDLALIRMEAIRKKKIASNRQ